MRNPVLALILGGFLAASASATTILVDFGTTPTTTGTPVWNNFNTVDAATSIPVNTSYSLVDTTGASTGYNITLTGGSVNALGDNPTSGVPTYAPFTPTTVVQDFVYASAARTFTLSGLNPSVSYDLTFYAYINRDTTRGTRYTVSGYTPLDLEPTGNPSAFSSGGQSGSINGVVPDSSGNITISVSSTASTNWMLSGLAINYTIPEPSAALLALLGPGALIFRRRRP